MFKNADVNKSPYTRLFLESYINKCFYTFIFLIHLKYRMHLFTAPYLGPLYERSVHVQFYLFLSVSGAVIPLVASNKILCQRYNREFLIVGFFLIFWFVNEIVYNIISNQFDRPSSKLMLTNLFEIIYK